MSSLNNEKGFIFICLFKRIYRNEKEMFNILLHYFAFLLLSYVFLNKQITTTVFSELVGLCSITDDTRSWIVFSKFYHNRSIFSSSDYQRHR